MPVIANGSSHFQTVTYTGNGSTNTITGLSFKPDFVWIKGRSGATDHALYDAVRGTTLDLASNTTAAETTQSTGLTSFNSDGFTLGALSKVNTNSATYVAWCWKANGSGTSNTSGSITSTVSANVTAGFSVVTYTGNGTLNATVGHGLGVSPSMVIIKNRGTATTGWIVWHTGLTGSTYYLQLNTTDAQANTWSEIRAVSSSTFTVGTDNYVNANTSTYVAYVFAPVSGYSAFGSYTGNGSATDGPFVFTGFRPRFIMFKNASAASTNWIIKDTARSTYNADVPRIFPNLSDTEYTTSGWEIDECANGFKVRATSSELNGSTNTIIYAAFAEVPFKSALAR